MKTVDDIDLLPGGKAAAGFALPVALVPLFADLSENELPIVQSIGRSIAVSKGQVLIDQGEACRGFYVVASGCLTQRKVAPNGLVFAVGRIKPGDFFGEGALIANHPSEVEVVATTPATLVTFRPADFRTLMERFPAITRRLIEELTTRIDRLANLSFEIATMKLDARLRRAIEELARESNQLHDGGIIRPAPTHAELATMLGTSREVVSRSLITLSRQGSIKTGRQQIQIRSVNGLNWTQG
ncbi:MAG: Crp/Fnr family transcriptional regulator [Azospirillaceae bacterium]|nr:Crp/Fnr family transcriptional regulator [Azospirillaceae bacterium]